MLEVPVEGAFADTEDIGCGWAAADLAALSCCGESGVGAFAEQMALEGGEGAEDEFAVPALVASSIPHPNFA